MKPYIIGLDLGGTNSVFGVVDRNGKIIECESIKTQNYKCAEDYAAAAAKTVKDMAEKVGGTDMIEAMGIGAPNANFYDGTIAFTPNIAWAHNSKVALASMLSERIGIPVAITNDANAAAMGEMIYGAARGMRNFIMITLGTGVGSGIVANGQMIYGHDGFAGELGHMIVRREDGRLCGCGRRGCLETYCSATGVARTAREMLTNSDRPSLLREIAPERITSLDVSIAASKGDLLAQDVYEFTGKILGEACADFATFLSPEAFIFFGGLTKAGDLLMKPLTNSYNANVLPLYKNKAKFLISNLSGASAAILGASALCRCDTHI